MRDCAHGWLMLWSYNYSPSFDATTLIHVDCTKLVNWRVEDSLCHLADRARPGEMLVRCSGVST